MHIPVKNVPGSRLVRTLLTAMRVALVSMMACAAIVQLARAGVPGFGCSTMPQHINLVGASSLGVDPIGEFTVVVRDLTCNPWPGSLVLVDFTAAGDLRIASDPLYPGVTADCPTRSVRATTGLDGVARFRIAGAASASPATSFGPNVPIYADGVLLGTLSVAAFDLDGSFGVGGADLAQWLADFGGLTSPNRSDYDGNGILGGADLSVWLGAYGASGSTASGTSYCP